MSNDIKLIQAAIKVVANHATKGEIAAWNRKRKSIERLITAHISPLEEKIIEINAELRPMYDQLNTLRAEMVQYCVHPIDLLLYKEGHIHCKFCNAILGVPHVTRNQTKT